jgi:predicted O-methyltransferase YrrM
MTMNGLSSGDARLDAFLSDGYMQIRGMSSRFAAAICGRVVLHQGELGIAGDLAELGTFEGRFFVAMAMLMKPGEHALGIDVFTWPSPKVYDHILENCTTAGLDPKSYTIWKVDTRTITAADLRAKLPGSKARFIHVDSEHIPECLDHELELARAVLHPDGVVALDDMLHPGYPTLITNVLDFLKRHPELRVMCIVDRESITAAAKFLICRADRAERYQQHLIASYPAYHYILGADFLDYKTLVLTLDPTLPKVE